MHKNLTNSNFNYKLSKPAIDLLTLLLKKDCEERIQPDELLYHPFFSDYNFDDYLNKKIESPLLKYTKDIKLPKFFIENEKNKMEGKGK